MMKKIFAVFTLLVAIGLLAVETQAGRKEDDSRFITEEQWTQEIDGKKVFIRERIATNSMGDVGSLPPMQPPTQQRQVAEPRPGVERRPIDQRPQVSDRPSDTGRQPQLPPGARPGGKFHRDRSGDLLYTEPGPRGVSYRFKPGAPGAPNVTIQNRIPANTDRDSGRVVKDVQIAPRRAPVVPYHLERGETISDLNRYTVGPATREILRSTGKTTGQAKRMRVGEPALIPEKRLKPEYRDPLKRIDELRAQLAELPALQAENQKLRQYINNLEQQIKQKDVDLQSLNERLAECERKIQTLGQQDQSQPGQRRVLPPPPPQGQGDVKPAPDSEPTAPPASSRNQSSEIKPAIFKYNKHYM